MLSPSKPRRFCMSHRGTHIACAVALALFAGTAHAREIADVNYPDELNVAGNQLKLVGVGLRTKWFFKVYTLAAYQATPKKDAAHLIRSNEPKMIWLHMKRTISGDKMRDALDEA